MKHAVIAGILFLLLLAGLLWNAAVVTYRVDTLCALAEHLPEAPAEIAVRGADEAEKIRVFWQDNRNYLSYSIHFCELEHIDDALSALTAAVKAGDDSAYLAAREKLLAFGATLADGERIRWENLF